MHTEPDPAPMIGFDGAADGTSVVVLARDPGGQWRIASSDGPDAAAIAGMATAIVARHDLPPRRFENGTGDDRPGLAEQVRAWMAENIPEPIDLNAWQQHVLDVIYAHSGPLDDAAAVHTAPRKTGLTEHLAQLIRARNVAH